MPKKETRIILNARRATHKRFEGTTSPFRSEFIDPCVARFSKISQTLFRIQRIGQLEQYFSTNSQSHLQFFCLLNSQKYSKISQKFRGLNNDLRCPLTRRLDKTTICTRSTVSSPLFFGFPLSKLLSIP